MTNKADKERLDSFLSPALFESIDRLFEKDLARIQRRDCAASGFYDLATGTLLPDEEVESDG